MKRRIISLFMALCMILLAVPALVLPVSAAEGHDELTTKFDINNNWPTYKKFENGEQTTKYTEILAWNGGWSMGRMYKGAYARYTGGGTYHIVTEGVSLHWTNTGVYLGNQKIITTAQPYQNTKAAVAYTYTAQYTGHVTLDMESLTVGTLDATSGAPEASLIFAIFINDEMVYPTKGGDTLEASAWKTIKSFDDIKGDLGAGKLEFDVQRGDNISFSVGSDGSCKTDTIMIPKVTYAAGWKVVPTEITDTLSPNGTTWPVFSALPGLRALQQLDARWTLGSYNVTTHEFTDYTHFNTKAGRTYGQYQHTSKTPWDEIGSIYIGSSANAALKGAFHLGASTEEFGAYRVKALASANAEFSIKGLQLISPENTAIDGTAVIEIYKDGALFKTINYTVAGGVATATLPTAEIKKGEELTFIVKSATAASSAVVAVAGSPVITCTEVESFMKEAPASGSGVAVDNADLIVGSEFGLRLYAYATQDIYEDLEAELTLYVWASNVEGEKTADNATAILPMTYNDDFAYYADFMGFSVRELTDDFSVQVVAKSGDTELAKSAVSAQNVVAMLTEQYEDEKDPLTKQLLVDMLNYAAAAQSHFNYNTDKMANAALTDAEKKLNDADEFYANFSGTADGGSLCHSEIGSFALILENKLSIRAYVDVSKYETNCDIQAKFGASLDDMEYADAVDLDDANSFTITDIGLDEMDKVFYMKLVVVHLGEDGDPEYPEYYFGYTITYSVETYAARMIDTEDPTLAALIRAMMQLGDTVKTVVAG